MQEYAFKASLGDDVYHDPASRALEEAVARLTGKEAGLFMPSGTMSNQIGLRTHLKQPPYSLLCDQRAHIHKYESGGAAFHSAAQVIPVLPANHHHLTLEDVKANAILDRNIHFATTELIALENTLNGTIIPQSEVLSIAEFAHSHGIAMHLDGARLWHVAVETGTPLSELCAPFDSVSLCFSKGLGAPVGSCLVGTAAFIQRARHFRKLFGGGMRQTGALTAAAAYAVTHHVPLLPRVHELSKTLERGLEEAGCEILSRAETCMIFFDPSPIGVDYSELDARAAALPEPIRISGSRLVVHIQTSPAAVADLISLVKTMAEERRAEGHDEPFVDAVHQVNADSEREWTRMSNEFVNAGYREGITAGKESALQGGFDTGFANTGAPIGREVGNLRGLAAGALSLLESSRPLVSERGDKEQLLSDIREIVNGLARLQFTDLAPLDEEALAHAKEHAESNGGESSLSASSSETRQKALSDLSSLRQRLDRLLEALGLQSLMPPPSNWS
ncbi:hypothetical protein ACEPAG_1125 [Sanghuangporus baumii]